MTTKYEENTIKKIALSELQLKLLDAKEEHSIIPDEVFIIIRNLKESYD